MPPGVQSLLRQENLSAKNLLHLPEVTPASPLRMWGVYLKVLSYAGTVVGLYTGSATSAPLVSKLWGLIVRIREHLRIIGLVAIPGRQDYHSAHYTAARQPGVSSNFRVLALFERNQYNRHCAHAAEGLLMLYLGTVQKSLWQRSGSFFNQARADLANAVSLGYIGLNRAWSLAQGFRSTWVTFRLHGRWVRHGNRDVCGNCQTLRPIGPNSKTHWTGYMEESRCHACSNYRRKHGQERPRELYLLHQLMIERTKKYDTWLADGNPDVCGNCGVTKPTDPDARRTWTGICEESRCRACSRYFGTHGEERPTSLYARNTIDQHQPWLDEGNADVCGNCEEPRPENWQQRRWLGFCEQSRCSNCYQYKERHGVERPFSKIPPKRKKRADHGPWLAQANADVCGNCGTPRPKNAKPTEFSGFCEESRCRPCRRWREAHNGAE